MSRNWTPTKKTVELKPAVAPAAAPRPSRIRREPVRAVAPEKLVRWQSREWEMWTALAGMGFFALGIAALVVDLGHVLGQ